MNLALIEETIRAVRSECLGVPVAQEPPDELMERAMDSIGRTLELNPDLPPAEVEMEALAHWAQGLRATLGGGLPDDD